MKRLALLALAFLIYIAALGPMLISAPSTIAVVVGITLPGILVWLAIKTVASILKTNKE